MERQACPCGCRAPVPPLSASTRLTPLSQPWSPIGPYQDTTALQTFVRPQASTPPSPPPSPPDPVPVPTPIMAQFFNISQPMAPAPTRKYACCPRICWVQGGCEGGREGGQKVGGQLAS
jgi:hypothetical protein